MTSDTLDPVSPSPDYSAAPVSRKPYTASNGQIWTWAIGGIASHGLIMTFGVAGTIFTLGFGLSAVMVGWAMMLPRVFDALLDPYLGHLSDNTHTRWGRRRPFLVVASVAGAIVLSALWWANPRWPWQAQFAYLLVFGSVFYVCYGLYTMAWTALGYELSDDYNERSRVAAYGGLVVALMALFQGWIYWLALRPMFGGEVYGMRVVSASIGVVIIVVGCTAAYVCKERFTNANRRKYEPLLPAIRETLRNRPFFVLLLFKLFQVFGDRVYGGILFYLSVYYVCRGDKDLATRIGGIGALIGMIVTLFMVPFMKPFSQQFGKRRGLVIGAVVAFLSALAQPLILNPNHPYFLLLPVLVLTPLTAISGTMANAVLPDICDLDELESGERREGLFTAVMGFVAKLEISLTVLIVSYLITFAGFDSQLESRWRAAASGTTNIVAPFAAGHTAVYRLSSDKPIQFDTFILNGIDAQSNGVKRFELLAGNDSATGVFATIGTFNVPFDRTGEQRFTFPLVTAKYLKFNLIAGQRGDSSVSLSGFRLTSSSVSSGMNSINLLSPDNGSGVALTTLTPKTLKWMLWLAVAPNVAFTFVAMVLAWIFPMNEGLMTEIRRKLDERHLQRSETSPEELL